MKRVLFVCVGNAARSQMAEGWFNHLVGESAVAESAGLKPASAISPKAAEVMMEEGVDISGQSPKRLTQQAMERADVIVTMGCGGACPLAGKPVQDWALPDPRGMDTESYRTLRNEIKSRVQALMASMGVDERD